MEPLNRDGSPRDDDAAELAGHTLAFASAACRLAKEIWAARRQAYDEPRYWTDLAPATRQALVLTAAWILSLQRRDHYE